MGLRVAAVFLLASVASATGEGAGSSFDRALPDGVDHVDGWTVVTGDFETTTERGAYRFYVNPARSAMYQLMRYRVELLAPANAEERRRGGAERVAFVRRPGVREPMACWEKQEPGASLAWRELAAGTDEYRMEMGVLIRVLAAHGAARAADSPP